jgi:hypothetical protein
MTREEFLRINGVEPTSTQRADTNLPSSAGARAAEPRNPNPTSSVRNGTSTGYGTGAARNSVGSEYLKSIGMTADRYGAAGDGWVGNVNKIRDWVDKPHDEAVARIRAEQARRDMLNLFPDFNPGGGGSGYRGGGGYGGPKNFKSFADQQMALINERRRNKVGPMMDVGDAPVDLMSDKIRELASLGKTNVDATWGGVPEMNTNAFRDYSPVQVKARDAQIAALLRSQGMGDGFAEAKQLQAEDDMALLDSFWTNYGGSMEANTDQANARMNADRMTMAANDKRQIEAEEMIQLTAAAKAQQDREEAYRQRQIQAQNEYAQQQTAADNTYNNEVFQLAQKMLEYGLQADQDLSGYDIAGLLSGSY